MENLKREVEVKTTLPKSENVFVKGRRKSNQCTMCDRCFLSNSKLQTHIKLKHIKKTYVCPNCGKKSEHKMKEHMISCSGIKFCCSICNKKFSSTEELNAHVDKHDFKKFQCDECLETFATKKLLKVHSKIHEQRFFIECDHCETICDNEDSLKVHLKSHTLEKTEQTDAPREKPTIQNFKCKRCRRRFKSEHRLKHHSVVCYLKIFTCEKCYLNYKSKTGLARHLCPKKDFVYKCNVCTEAFGKKDDLFKHFFVHKFTQGIDLCM